MDTRGGAPGRRVSGRTGPELCGLALSACVILGIACTLEAEMQGDPELLRLVAATNRSNLDSLRTWRGSAVITDMEHLVDDKGAAFTMSLRSTGTFVYDKDRKSTRWRFAVEEATETREGVARPAPEQIDTRDEMVKPEGYFCLSAGYKKIGSDVWERSLAILPQELAAQQVQATSRSLDPMWYLMLQDLPVSDRLSHYYDLSQQGQLTRSSVRREGNRVVVEIRSGKESRGVTRWTFDLDRGGNLVHQLYDAEEAGGGMTQVDYEYTRVNGVWVPARYRCVRGIRGEEANPKRGGIREVVFQNNVVNEPVKASEFSLEAMGVKVGTRISDNRVGLFWIYGQEAESARPVMREGESATVDVPTVPMSAETVVPGPAEGSAPLSNGPVAVSAEAAQGGSAARWWLGAAVVIAGALLGLGVIWRRRRARKGVRP